MVGALTIQMNLMLTQYLVLKVVNFGRELCKNAFQSTQQLLNTVIKYSINTVIKYYERRIQGDHFHLASVFKNSILTILKTTQVSKVASLGGKRLAKPVNDLCNLSILKNFIDICQVAKFKPLHKKASLTQPCNCKPTLYYP